MTPLELDLDDLGVVVFDEAPSFGSSSLKWGSHLEGKEQILVLAEK